MTSLRDSKKVGSDELKPQIEKENLTEKIKKNQGAEDAGLKSIENKKESQEFPSALKGNKNLNLKTQRKKENIHLIEDKQKVSVKKTTQEEETPQNKEEPKKKDNIVSGLSPVIDMTYEANCYSRINTEEGQYYYSLHGITDSYNEYAWPVMQIDFCDNVSSHDMCIKEEKDGIIGTKDTCVMYAGTKDKLKVWEFIDNKTLQITLPEGDICSKEGEEEQRYRVKVTITCEPKRDGVPIISNYSGFDTCNPQFAMRHKAACGGEKFESWGEVIGLTEPLLGSILIAVGVAFLLFGEKIKTIFCFALMSASVTIILLVFLKPAFDLQYQYFVILGVCIGILLASLTDYVVSSLSLLVSILVGMVLFFFFKEALEIESIVIQVIIIAVLAGLVFVSSNWMQDKFYLILSVICGALLVVRGLGMLSGTMPDENHLMSLSLKGEHKQLKAEIASMITLNVIQLVLFLIVGFIVQYSTKTNDKDKQKGDGLDNKEIQGGETGNDPESISPSNNIKDETQEKNNEDQNKPSGTTENAQEDQEKQDGQDPQNKEENENQ
eukprot:CAMPEP_0170519364 /NCGR_PEP_ID=MMETSP0209-20121228/4804_1 /TAXON_ID=665100 ORGANISM="Litonotus pictus, Strain P1" /NCGR_SAMPLE_ID=MMETSP0209 /ASSEMBLY_ACC=CAM_ASM_000301 /LENGTH=551 /DNA_ID=CAMNT_0010805225 /DNA_START=248 /DNA_END=1903 /DNA_ORIENTATION=-